MLAANLAKRSKNLSLYSEDEQRKLKEAGLFLSFWQTEQRIPEYYTHSIFVCALRIYESLIYYKQEGRAQSVGIIIRTGAECWFQSRV